MMIPDVGSMPKVSGSSSATPEGGPTPGSAPIRMPRTTPHVAMSRLNGVSATEKPSARLARKSIAAVSEAEHADGQRHVQPVGEDEEVHPRHRERDRDRERPRVTIEEADHADQEKHRAADHPDDLEQRHQRDRRAEHENESPQGIAARQPVLTGVGSA